MSAFLAVLLLLVGGAVQAQPIVVDLAAHGGPIYFATRDYRVLAYDSAGLRTIAGTGVMGVPVDGPALAPLGSLSAIAAGPHGVYVCESNHIRRIAGGQITTLAGNGVYGFQIAQWGDGGPALNAQWRFCTGLAVLGSAVYFTDQNGWVARRVDGGAITRVAGDAVRGRSGDGGSALVARMLQPVGIAAWGGEVSIVDRDAHQIRRVNIEPVSGAVGMIQTVVNPGGFANDELYYPRRAAYDSAGRMLFTDQNNHRLRRLDRDGTIVTVAGQQGVPGHTGDGGPASSATLFFPALLTHDVETGVTYVANAPSSTSPMRLRKIDAAGIITTVDLLASPPVSTASPTVTVQPTSSPTRTVAPPTPTPTSAVPNTPVICADLESAADAIESAQATAGCP